MDLQTVELLDRDWNVLAAAHVAWEGTHYGGTIDLTEMPEPYRALFQEFEEIVNDQVFGLLDDIDERIESLGISARLPDGSQAPIVRLQVWPQQGTVSFDLVSTTKPIERMTRD